MKRIALSFLLFLILVGSAYAISGTTSFKINAYKVGTYDEPHITMEAYDALEANLTTIKSGNQLDLSHYTSNLKNNSEDTSYSVEPYDRHVIFSFHVDGNYNGSFKLSVSIGPLVHSNSDGTVKDSSHVITAYYEMRDTSCVFTSTYKSTGEKGGKASTPTLSPSNITVSDSNPKAFVSKWTISNIQTGKYENWRALGSVGISIDRISYKTAADTPERNGLYMADVTITLEAI
ncbi:MAG: hypothetical protein MR687_00400 [Spirochaetales bacterium]|nr:hypothetical protein [Spirochaetales bacterium]